MKNRNTPKKSQANNSTGEQLEDTGETAEGLQEGQNTDQHQEEEEKHEEGDAGEAQDTQEAADNAEGLKESQAKEAAKAAVTGVVASAEQNSANARPAKRPKKDGSETTLSLTSGRLKLHEKTQAAIKGLKEGTLSEAGFWDEINSKDKAALWKKYEGARNKVPEAKEAWQQMGGLVSWKRKISSCCCAS